MLYPDCFVYIYIPKYLNIFNRSIQFYSTHIPIVTSSYSDNYPNNEENEYQKSIPLQIMQDRFNIMQACPEVVLVYRALWLVEQDVASHGNKSGNDWPVETPAHLCLVNAASAPRALFAMSIMYTSLQQLPCNSL